MKELKEVDVCVCACREGWRRDRERKREVGKEKRGDLGETNEKENENRIKIEAERNPHFSFQPADSMPGDQTIRPDGFGRLSQLRARKMMGG